MAAAAVVICASLGATGFMLYHHHTITRAEEHKQSISAEANAAARQIVVTLMTLDAKNAAVNIRQVIDNSTGQFREQMESGADEMIKSLQKAQVSTRVRVGTTAVESVSDDSAVVLVAAYSELNAPDSPDRKPRSWQIALTLNRDAGVLKLSKIDFL